MTRYADPGILPRVEVYAERRMLKAAEPVMVLQIAADEHPLPKNRSDTIVLRRPVPLEPVTTPLLEGITPDITPFRFEDVRGTLQQFGQVTQITDKVQIMHEDPVLMKMVEQLGKNVGRTNERLMWGELRAGTNVFYGNGSSRAAVNTAPVLDDVQNVVQELETQHAEPFSKVVQGSVLINTSPVEESYIAFCHTHLMHDIRAMAGFVPVSQYGSMKRIHPRELGATENVRWVRSPDLPPFYGGGRCAWNHGSRFGRQHQGGRVPHPHLRHERLRMRAAARIREHGAEDHPAVDAVEVRPAGAARIRGHQVVVFVRDHQRALDGSVGGRCIEARD